MGDRRDKTKIALLRGAAQHPESNLLVTGVGRELKDCLDAADVGLSAGLEVLEPGIQSGLNAISSAPHTGSGD